MTTFVLVPGACHGGWWYADVVSVLEGRGHRARALTLAGLDPEADRGAAAERPLGVDDAAELLDAYLRNREHLRPFEPVRPDAFWTLEGQRERLDAMVRRRVRMPG